MFLAGRLPTRRTRFRDLLFVFYLWRRYPFQFIRIELYVFAVCATDLLGAVGLTVTIQHSRRHRDDMLTANPANQTEKLQSTKDV